MRFVYNKNISTSLVKYAIISIVKGLVKTKPLINQQRK